MNAKLMSEYIGYCADRLVTQLGHKPFLHGANPFSWMELMSLQGQSLHPPSLPAGRCVCDQVSVTGKTNFFDKRVGDYSKVSRVVFFS